MEHGSEQSLNLMQQLRQLDRHVASSGAMHDSSWLLIGILIVVPALSLLARAIRIPYPIVLVLGG